MDIVILGAGNVGRALAGAWAKEGHNVMLAVRDSSRRDFEDLESEGVRLVDTKGAAKDGDVIIVAVPWNAVAQALKEAGSLKGKIVVDATNPLTPDYTLAIGHTDSAGETIARLAAGAKVVKAFNTTGAHNMADSDYPGGQLVMPVAGDDTPAKETVIKLAADLGFDAIDVGPLAMSRYLEPMAMLWIKLATSQKMGTGIGFALLKR
jgi:predicted dinucleotide-binding enzyme